MTPVDRIRLEHFTLRQVLEMEACTRCGECIPWCPTYVAAGDEAITPLAKIGHFRAFWKAQHLGWLARLFGLRKPTEEDVAAFSRGTYACTLCGRCAAVCPVHIRTRDLWIGLREQLVDWRAYPEVFRLLQERLAATHNISGDENAQRLIWAENLEVQPPALSALGQADTVYFVGCVSSFYPTVYSVPQAFAGILAHAGVDFAVLGPEEWCCGFPLVIAGMGREAEALAKHNVEAVERAGARRLVTTCPSCYHTWQHTYPQLLGRPLGFAVLHATELLVDLVHSDLPLKRLEMRVTYHDPCDLGRTSGLYDPPREALRAIPGVDLVEMAETRERALCCGGGGDVEMGDPGLTEKVAAMRLAQALDTGAQTLATACQQCKRTLAAQARKDRVRLRVVDVAELLWQALRP